MQKKFSIIIPTVKSENLEICLESIKKYTNLDLVEIIIVANGYNKPLRDDPSNSIKVIWFNEMIGYPAAINSGIQAASGEYVIPLNDDTFLIEQPINKWLDLLIQPFLEDEKVGITGPMKTYSPSARRNFLIFFCVMIKKSMFEKIGLLDMAFSKGYGEDTAFCIELENAGYKMIQVCPSNKYFPNSTVMEGIFPIVHKGNKTFCDYQDNNLIIENNKILFERYGQYEPNIDNALKCDGFINDNELIWLGKEAMKRKVVVSIGSWHGKSDRVIADNLMAGGILYTVDTWGGSRVEQETSHASAKLMDGDHAFYEFLQNNFDLIQAGKIIPLRMTSKNAAKFMLERGILADMVFIDASHEYEDVCSDIDGWRHIIKEDGIFCGHDKGNWIGVDRAISDKLKSYSVMEGGSIWYTDKSNIHFDPPAIFDIFPFLDELDILELRFETLYDVVDRFIITESTRTHQNKPKELVFEKNLKRFERFLNKVTYLVQDYFPSTDSWSLERGQREKGLDGLRNAKGNDICIVGDIDEIPNPDAIKSYKPEFGIMGFEQKLYYYNFNCQAKDPWREAKIGPYREVRERGLCGTRYTQCPSIPNGGWHFSYFGGTDNIIKKIECSAHIENNREEFKTKDYIERAVKEGKDLFGRNLQYKYVEIDSSYPIEVFNNQGYYKKKGMIV